jgi:hypothetical protein
VEDYISFEDGGALSVFHRLGKNVVAIIVVQDHQIVVACTRRRDEASSLVSIDWSSGLYASNAVLAGGVKSLVPLIGSSLSGSILWVPCQVDHWFLWVWSKWP